MMTIREYFARWRGNKEQKSPAMRPLSEIAWSTLGGFLGIYGVYWLNAWIGIAEKDSLYLVGSFGATAVLIYGVPSGDLSQPRNLVVGHVLSALVGVAMAMLLPGQLALPGALAVALAIGGMHLTRTVHPPGGATALIAVIGGPSIHKLGFMYALTPVLLGALIMLVVALIVNNFSASVTRHYPRYWL